MEMMSRRRRTTVSAILASLALLTTLPAPCGCLPEPVTAAEHGCCAPAGVRAADPGCCAAAKVAADAVTAPSVAPAVAPTFAVLAWVTPPAVPVLDRAPASPAAAVSPPLTVRRL
jgi:hypothetical protein